MVACVFGNPYGFDFGPVVFLSLFCTWRCSVCVGSFVRCVPGWQLRVAFLYNLRDDFRAFPRRWCQTFAVVVFSVGEPLLLVNMA